MTSSKTFRRVVAGVALLLAGAAHPGDLGRAETGEALSADGLVEIYRQSLEDLERPRAAALTLADGEARFAGDSPAQTARELTRAELTFARGIAAHDLEALVPVIFLHHQAMAEHDRRRRPHLRQHALTMVRILADFYAREGRSEGSRKMAARWLASLAGRLQASGAPSSLELFERSLELDAACLPALFGLAAHYEKRGGPYATALAYLERLYEIAPENSEARLRLAIQLERAGRRGEARRLLEALLAGPGTGWTYSLAAQELARWQARDGLLDEAVAVLEAALRNRPDDQKLHLLLAFLHDRSRDPHEARRLARRLSSGLGPSEPARGIYNRWPSASLAEARDALRRAVDQRLPLLREALAVGGGGG